jgi:hypothetical protein
MPLRSDTGGLFAEYLCLGKNASIAFALTAGTLGTWSDRSFVADGALAGAYELGFPNAAIAEGVPWVIVRLRGAANMLAAQCEIELDAFPYNTNPFAGMTSLATWVRLTAKGFRRRDGA